MDGDPDQDEKVTEKALNVIRRMGSCAFEFEELDVAEFWLFALRVLSLTTGTLIIRVRQCFTGNRNAWLAWLAWADKPTYKLE